MGVETQPASGLLRFFPRVATGNPLAQMSSPWTLGDQRYGLGISLERFFLMTNVSCHLVKDNEQGRKKI